MLTRGSDLVHGDRGLNPGGHGVHPSAHPQEVNGLVLLTDGVLCVDPGHLHVALLDGLRDTRQDEIQLSGFPRS